MSCKLLLLLSLISRTAAQLSLYIPDTDPQPLSAIELGVGSDGRTTWEILPGQPTGSWVGQVEDFPTLTLAEGPSDAILTGAPDLNFAVSCTLLPTTSPGAVPLAACTNLADGGAGWEEAATPLAVQTGAAGAVSTAAGGSGVGSVGGTGSATNGGSPNGPVSGSPMVPSSTSRPQVAGAVRLGGAGWSVALGLGVALCAGVFGGWY
ncbi:hypothetical protein CALVIDRAFT_566908 [Calocera viscosa TUFC12733]|uniref:Uncharacterized protein n=1 Tax=Calocera viscosa (strain TUFC12733) TaxID=1330018 RepID=A0A167IV25_CALVF|nr:hypothetical protein CALVIDRAFT_566908 [Calocera viscosa TUFC12733]